MKNRMAVFALVLAGFCWGSTGLFVRLLGREGLSVYELLVVRLVIAGVVILPLLIANQIRAPRWPRFGTTLFLGVSMVLYYLGAITAFQNLPLFAAALIIGSSPLIAWFVPLILGRRFPKAVELSRGRGVLLSIVGLIVLVVTRQPASQVSDKAIIPSLGYLGAITAAIVTVVNARLLNRIGTNAPRPFEITMATVLVGLGISPVLISNVHQLIDVSVSNFALVLGFGIAATAVPGVAIAYASVRLNPQATATVSIQLQVWAGALAWIFLGEAMDVSQIVAALLMITGSWICLMPVYGEISTCARVKI